MNLSGKSNDSNLPDLFEKIWNEFDYLENTCDSVNSTSVQKKVNDVVDNCNKAVEMINKLDIFSTNENMDEITTMEIKYMLLPAFLGYFTNKRTKEERLEVVVKAKECYQNFIELCKTFGLTNVNLKSENEDGIGESEIKMKPDSEELLKADIMRRREKIERYKAKHALEKELQQLYIEVKKEHVDEDIQREYYLRLVNKWISDSVEALESLENEISILKHIMKMREKGNTEKRNETDIACNGRECHKHTRNKFQPFIITKNELQKAVFGIGYPSLPTVTVDEFYDERVQKGLFPGPDAPVRVQPDEEAEEREKDKEAAEKENKEELDDPVALRKARGWDEYRDDHRRGWGNTHNKG